MTTLTAPPPAASAVPGSSLAVHRKRRLERGGLVALLLGTSLLYMVNLGASGYANEFYAAAVQAGTKSWKAFFFGSFDSANFITVDKPPMSLWPMELSGRIFGFNAWSMLLPQGIEGVLTVWLLYATVRRWFGPAAGLIAGTALALTPVAVLMFRYNQPDAMMTLLIVAAAYSTTRAIEAASTKWLTLAGVAIGFSFLVKGLQPFTVLPALALAYVVAAPTSLRRRLLQLLAAAAGALVGAGWWVAAVALTPVSDRPYIGGSGNNSALGLAFGYNGLGRITGDESTNGSGGQGGGAGANFSGHTGIGRLFNSLNGGQVAWLIPAALIALGALVVVAKRASRTDRIRAAAIMWGGWLVVTGAVLSYAGGIIHTYYTVELAPAIGALVGIGAVVLWRIRAHAAARAALAAATVVTGVWSYELLHRSANWHPAIGYVVLLAAIVAGIVVALPPGTSRRVIGAGAAAAVIAVGAGSSAYAIDTAATAHNGSIPSAGPTISGSGGFGGPGGRTGGPPGSGGPPRGSFGSGSVPSGAGGFPGGPGAFPGQGSGSTEAGGIQAGPAGAGETGRAGGTQTVNAQLAALLEATTTKWAAATVGSQSAAPLELSTGKAVIAIGGFSGSDNAPTLAQFEQLVAQGKVRYFIAGGGAGGGPGGGSGSSAIVSWVESHFSSTTVGGTTVYDLQKVTS